MAETRERIERELNRADGPEVQRTGLERLDRKSTRLNSSPANISYAVFCLNKKNVPFRFCHSLPTPLSEPALHSISAIPRSSSTHVITSSFILLPQPTSFPLSSNCFSVSLI